LVALAFPELIMKKHNQAENFSSPRLSKADWNFDAVPDVELVACCYWEYARESAFLVGLKRNWDAWDGCGRCPEVLAQGFNRIQQAAPHTFVYLQAILAESSFPEPWQKLPGKSRQRLVKLDLGIPAALSAGGDLVEAERALEAARAQIKAYRTAVDELHAKWPGYGEATLQRRGLWPKTQPLERTFWDDGYESLVVRIAWENHTNEQILESFRQWLKQNRPKQMPAPSGKGHKLISQRVALERLGIMRLLHCFRPVELREQLPAAWQKYNSANRRWQKDAQKAVAEFHQFFPILKDEHPLSWPPMK
jgi:hypothetical protein